MRTSPGCGVVRWIDPPAEKLNRDLHDRSSSNENGYEKMNNNNLVFNCEGGYKNKCFHGETGGYNDSLEIRDHKSIGQRGCGEQQPIISLSICRIICTIVEQHLYELQDHQKLVNRARVNLANSESWTLNDPGDPISMYRRDTCKLKVRNQQTKAIETIKQLTNYLREITYSMAHNPSVEGDDEVFNRLSDIRTEIVQALNDFVLSNSDIDIPIFDSDDLQSYDYDLLTDARKTHNNKDMEEVVEFGDSRVHHHGDEGSIDEISSIISDRQDDFKLDSGFVINSEAQFSNLDKRKQDIEKLERDTEELRLLFSDFYSLVKSHGKQIDSIEDNIVIAIQRVGNCEIQSQQLNSKVKRGLTILVPVTGCMAGVLVGGPLGLVVGGKLGGITIACATSLLGLISSYKMRRCIVQTK